MLNLFKKMLSRSEPTPAPAPARPAPAARPGATPPPPRPRPAATATGPVRVTPVAQATAATAIPAAPIVTSIPPTPNGTHVYVSLGQIAASVPETISHKVPANQDQFVAIPLELVVPQLAYGQVLVTAAELRACSPEQFHALAGHDEVSITLPLADIVKQVPPEHFARRNKRRVEVPHEVASVFAPNGGGITVAKPAPAAAPQPAAAAYRAQPAPTTTTAQPVPAPASPASKISMSPQALAALKAATAPSPASAPATPRPTVTPRAITPAPGAPANPLPTAAPTSAPAPSASRPVAVPLPKKAAAAPKLTGNLAVPLASVCNEWDQDVRRQIADLDVAQHQILVPLELLEPAMKSGKVLFSWSEVAGWMQPPLPSPPTPKVGEMPVEMPLRVLAPLFMASQNAAAQKRVAIDETIPDLFGGNGNGNGAPTAQVQQRAVTPSQVPAPVARMTTPAPAQPAARPVATPAPSVIAEPTPLPSSAANEPSLDEIVGEAGSRFGAKEIISHAARLPGVAGALLAMSDGLLVTSNTPPSVKAETIAAFLPQMFGRMNQYTKELALGPLQELTLGVEAGQWHVVKCPNIYFAVLGKRGETLPLNLLAQVAAELSSQSK